MGKVNKPQIFSNEFCQKFDIQFPIIQAPMAGGGSCPKLVSAVGNNGAIGFLAAGYLSADDLEKQIIETKKLTKKPFGVNLFIIDREKLIKAKKPANIINIEKELGFHKNSLYSEVILDEEIEKKLDIIIKHNIQFVSFTFGLPDKKYLDMLKQSSTYLIGTATNIIEAKLIENSKLDAIVAQGVEAGGHRGSFLNHKINDEIGLISLLEELTGNLNLPIIASGGIVSGKSILAAKILGAKACQIGTAFLLTEESGISLKYKEALLNCHAHETILTDKVSGKKARGKINTLISELETKKGTKFKFPVQNFFTKELRGFANKNNLDEYLSLWCGQSVWKIKKIKSVANLIEDLNNEFNEALALNKKN
ncbi:nitronate monooxygenase [Pigmentibacter sp. JX0631]|uniref:NAD(P)H-dependent flavin oxidoreductase n=1 Tax=Pigmentibacter sp. JX0631 TaxID=2976982 RepID=UPI002468BAC7|nr:nitronate monooxygenase [Pigmentibacter sp. JX0631]WGL61393.1 nitronate monooxygenase [Pigmentibacter sp. JX0631]